MARQQLQLHDVGKLIGLIVVVICATVLRATDHLEPSEFSYMVGPVVGYIVGNGVGAVRRSVPSPVIAPRWTPDELAAMTTPQLEALHDSLAKVLQGQSELRTGVEGLYPHDDGTDKPQGGS
jgi:hypothetical protein